MTRRLQLIVEGDGDVLAMPVLLRRIFEARALYDVQIAQPPHRRGDLPKVRRRFSDYFEAAALEGNPVLCVLDYDCDDCEDAVREEDQFRRMAQELRPSFPFQACFLVKEYESLFLCNEEVTRSVLPRFRADYVFPSDPEAVRDAKGELSSALEKGWSYKPMVHQAKLSAQIQLDAVRACSPSFRRLERCVDTLFRQEEST